MALGGPFPFSPPATWNRRPGLVEQRPTPMGKPEVRFSAATIALILGAEAIVLGLTGVGAALPRPVSITLDLPVSNGSTVVAFLPPPSWGWYEVQFSLLSGIPEKALSISSCADASCAWGLTSLLYLPSSMFYPPFRLQTIMTNHTDAAYLLVTTSRGSAASSGLVGFRLSTVWAGPRGVSSGGNAWEEVFSWVTGVGLVAVISSLAAVRYGHAQLIHRGAGGPGPRSDPRTERHPETPPPHG